ncbi:aminodeoxychorismate synthase component I [Arenibaculum pallidiluteum]|uniref:aminodeoxychorismate synthase component I n=1 Tax=Arenibaculum pallidiluteum TaxID=2812559 RepID=UPI001A973360|nr:aminodeoxychorismate synthase component I [Arenibaculum pallidiluteum]
MIVLPIPFRDPADAFLPFAGRPWSMLLDGAVPEAGRGRWAYLCTDPRHRVTAEDDRVLLDGEAVAGDPFAALEAALARLGPLEGDCPAPFRGGAVGFLGYELGRWLERLPARHGGAAGLPDMAVGLYDTIAAFDVVERRAWVVSDDAGRARRLADALESAGSRAAPPDADPGALPRSSWRPDLTRDEYAARLRRVLGYIAAGDIYQANFTQRFTAPRAPDLDAYALYRRLRGLSPAPFAAFLNLGPGLQVASASPERFLRLDAGGRIETRPIKGTRPRRRDPAEDRAEAEALAASVKDRAENLMIVDLLRNDLSRVAEPGSVRVPELCRIESFASVHHLVSSVEARLRAGLGPVDLLRASFPGGSITGAPKIRAMEIIDELEASRRGPYCGSVLWIGRDGAMDSSIVIRTLVLTAGTVTAQAGGGIVADSDPGAEWEEMLTKLRPLLATLGGWP